MRLICLAGYQRYLFQYPFDKFVYLHPQLSIPITKVGSVAVKIYATDIMKSKITLGEKSEFQQTPVLFIWTGGHSIRVTTIVEGLNLA